MDHVIIYTQEGCTFCDDAKQLLTNEGIAYSEFKIGKDLTKEDFKSRFPNQKTVPFMIADGNQIGGFQQLQESVTKKYLAG